MKKQEAEIKTREELFAEKAGKSYYEYHSGYRPVPPDHVQYILKAIASFGWTQPVEFNSCVEEFLW